MNIKKIFLILVTFICVFFYGSSKDTESIHSVSSKRPAELNLKITKKKSAEELMHIDKENKKIFYFFGDEGLIKGDFINVTEKLSEQGYTSKTFSKISGNKNELRYSNQEKNDNLKYMAERGAVTNRVVVGYRNEPKNIFIEFYDRLKNLKKVVKNRYEEIGIKEIFGEFDTSKKEFTINFAKTATELEETSSKDKIEIFTFEKDGKTQNLDFTVEQSKGSEKGSIKVKTMTDLENVYLAHFDNQNRLRDIYLLKESPKDGKNLATKSSYFTWSRPVIDITQWDRKTKKISKMKTNMDIVYGTETISNGITLPYIDIKMGTLTIPNEVITPKVAIENPNELNYAGQVLLTNEQNKNIVGRIYLKSESLSPKTPVKGLDYQEILDSTSVIEYSDEEVKNADIYLRLYDLPETEESLFIAGNLKYIKGENSRNIIEIFDENNVILQKEALPEIEILDIRDNIKESIKIAKKNINISEELGVNIGDDIQWTRRMQYVDIKLAEINITGFENKTTKIKNPYIEIDTANAPSGKLLESSGNTYELERYYLRLKNGTVDRNDIIIQDEEILGYSKIGTRMNENHITDISADVVVRLSKEEYESFTLSSGNVVELKNEESTPAVLKIIYNEDYPEQALEIPYNTFKVIKSESERKNNDVKIDALIFFNDINENAFNLIFDPAKNSSGNISIRGNSESISSTNIELIGDSVFDMNKGIISRTYKSDDTIEALNVRGITAIATTEADFSKDGYKSVTFSARGMSFELKFWNNTDKVELSVVKSSSSQGGEIYGEFLLKDANGDIHNKVTLNLYSGIEKPGLVSDNLRIWREYVTSTEWGTEVEVVNTTTGSGSAPNLTDEGGLSSLTKPFVSYGGDSVFLEPIKGVGEQGIGSKALVMSAFKYKENFGTISNNRLEFEPSGKGNAKLELTLTRDFIESYFPVGKPSLTLRTFEVAEIVYGKGKRRVPVSARLQLRYYGSATSSYPIREVSNHTGSRYYQNGLYSKVGTVAIEDITIPGQERDIAEITPTTVGSGTSGIVPSLTTTKNFRGKNVEVKIRVTAPTTGNLNNAGVELNDVLLTKTPELFGIFTMRGGSEQIKEHEIWIPKYSPSEEIQSLTSSLHNSKSGAKQYEKDLKVEKYDTFDRDSTLEVIKPLGFIKILGRDKTRADIIRRNSSTLNFAKLPDRVKLQSISGEEAEVDGFLSFSNSSLIKEIEQVENVDQELTVYLIVASENVKKINHGVKYRVIGEYEAGRVDQDAVNGSNLLYYGLKTDNEGDLGLNEYIYEPVFKLDLNASINQSSAVVLNLDNYSKKPLPKANELSKNIRIYKSFGKYSTDIRNPINYMDIEIQGKLIPYDVEKTEFKNRNHILKVIEEETGKVFTGIITPQGGKVEIDGEFLNFTIQYSDAPEVKYGFSEAVSLEVLNIGINEYKYAKGSSKYTLKHLDPDDTSKVLISDEILIKVPEFEPKNWYYNDTNLNPLENNPLGKFKLSKGQELIFELGEVGMISGRDIEITKGEDDKEGVRIEYDKNITLEHLDDPSIKISGTILLLDSNGNILPDQSITHESQILAISINKLQTGYDSNAIYVIKDLVSEKSESIVNKPIRIGRKGQWQGLAKSIAIEASADKVFGQFFKWNPSLVDITEWAGKRFKKTKSTTNFEVGTESFLGKEFPYIDINMGTVTIPIADPKQVGDSFRLKSISDENTKGKIILKNKNGDYIEGRLYFKSDLDILKVPVMGKNNSPIEGGTAEVMFKGLKEKTATVHLRIYDSEMENASLFVEGATEYIKNRISDNTIEILSEGKVLYSDNTMSEIEFIDTRDTLLENVLVDKKVLDFTYDAGKNAGDDIQWTLGNRFVDVRLVGITIDNFDDKVEKFKDPYIEIDTQNEIPSTYLEINGNRVTPYRYFIKLHMGQGAVEDEITEGSYVMGYKKISTNIEDGKINNLKGDIVVRLLSEDYARIKDTGEKSLRFRNSDGTVSKAKLILNSDHIDKEIEIDLGEYNILTAEEDKLDKVIDLKVLLVSKELKATKSNLVFDLKNNSRGDIEIRGNEQNIESRLGKIEGLSVFDMSGEGVAQVYDKADTLSIELETGDIILGDAGAKFEIDGYKGVKFRQRTTNIEYEIRFWNNTKKIEIVVDKASYSGGQEETRGTIEILGENGRSKLKLKLVLNSSLIDSSEIYMVAYGSHSTTTAAYFLIDESLFSYSDEWNTEVVPVAVGKYANSGNSTVGVDIRVDSPLPTYSGDNVYVQIRDRIPENNLSSDNFYLESPVTGVAGDVRDGKLYLDSSGSGRARIAGVLTRENFENIWRGPEDPLLQKQYIYEMVFGNGKRRIPQYLFFESPKGSSTAYLELESKIIDTEQKFQVGTYYQKNQRAQVKDENENIYLTLQPNEGDQDHPGLIPKEFRGKNINVRFGVYPTAPGNVTNFINMSLNEIVLSKTEELFGIFRVVRTDTGAQERNIHTIIMPKYNPIDEAYSTLSSLETTTDGKGKLLNQKLEILRDKLDDATTTIGIVKNLGNVGLLGRDSLRGNIMKRNSTTLNTMKLPDRIVLQKIENGEVKDSLDASLSFSPIGVEKEFTQIENMDQERNIYLHIEKVEAERLEPGAVYSIYAEYNEGRISEKKVSGKNIAYLGLRTDNTADLGLDEYIYEPLFQINIQTEIAQDVSVKLVMSEDKPLIKSNGNNNLVRVYLSDAKYSTDIINPESYSSLTMGGLLTPYEHNKVEYGNSHDMIIRLEGSLENIRIPLSKTSGGQGVLKTLAGDIYIGYLNNPDLQNGTVAASPLEILTIGMKEYNLRGGSFKLNIEHIDPSNGQDILEHEALTITIPNFLPKEWYYNATDSSKLLSETKSFIRFMSEDKIIYPLGNVSLYPDRDTEITKGADDSRGVRIEYDSEIVLLPKDGLGSSIKGRIVKIDGNGSIIPDSEIYGVPTQLAIEVDTKQSGYDFKTTYVYDKGNLGEISKEKLDKPIRIGREEYWEGLVKTIELNPSIKLKWNSSLVDITDWKRKKLTRNIDNKEFFYGEEVFLGETIPYIDIEVGEVDATNSKIIKGIKLKSTDGNLLLKNINGNLLEGRIYLRAESTSTIEPVKDKNNNVIIDTSKEIIFCNEDRKIATIHLRIYDSEKESASLFVEGVTKYINNRISDNTIEILAEGKVVHNDNTLYSDNTMPEIEFVDTRDSLKENAFVEKRILDFTYTAGTNAGDDIQWALANRFVDVRLMGITIDNFDDKVEKFKDPYIEIDTENSQSSTYLQVNEEIVNPYRYFIKLHTGKGEVDDEITEGSYIMGYKKISTNIEHGKINNLKGDIIVRLLSEDYARIKDTGEKSLRFRNSDGTVPKAKLVFNADHVDKGIEIDLGEYDILTTGEGKANKVVDLKMLLSMKEIKETTTNLVFDYSKNKTGNISLRAAGKSIEDILTEISGVSVFDMSGELLSQAYNTTDWIDFSSMVDATDIKDSGAKFEIDDYKALSFTQSSTNIKYEVRFWNNTKKVEIFMDKSAYNGSSIGEVRGTIEVKDIMNNSKIKLNLVLSVNNIEDNEEAIYRLRSGLSQGSGPTAGAGSVILFDEKHSDFEYSPEWNTEIIKSTDATLSAPLDIGLNYKTYTGDTIIVEGNTEIQPDGLSKENLILKTSTTLQYGRVEEGKLILDSDGNGRAKIAMILTREQLNTIWRDSEDISTKKIPAALQITYGNGKRRLKQWIQGRYFGAGGVNDGYENITSDILDNNQMFKMGSYLITSAKEIPKVRDENDVLYLDLPFPTDVGDYSALTTRNFRDKEVGVRFTVTGGQNTKTLSMLINDIVLTKDREDFGTFRIVRPSTGGRERYIHRIISPRYSPIEEVYSALSSLETTTDGKGKLLNQKLEILRDKLDDATTTIGIVKNLGSVSLLGRDSIRGSIMKRNSTRLNTMKLPDKIFLQKIENGEVKESLNASLSFSPTGVEKEFTQIENVDQDRNIYLHVEKVEAERLEPGAVYSIYAEYNEGRISEKKEAGKNIAYLGLKTDNTADLGLDEYIYEPLFQMNIQTEIAQDTSVKLLLSDDKPLIKSDGNNNLMRVYLSEAKYSTDIVNPESYSSLTMRGLLTPYEYNKPEYGDTHNMIVTDVTSGNKTTISVSKTSGGQGVLKTVAGDIFIGYLNNPDLQNGTVAASPLEVLTIGMKEYSLRDGNLEIEIEHIDPTNPGIKLETEKFSLSIPRFLPKRWYYNTEDYLKVEEEATGSVKYTNSNNLIYPLGNVGLYADRDLELTKSVSDPLGVRIEYDEEIEFVNKNNPSNKIVGKIARIDSMGNILAKETIYTTTTKLAVVIDISQNGFQTDSSYIYTGGNVNEINANKTDKIVRVGREGYWEGLIKSIEIKRVSIGELILNYDFNYPRGKEIEFDSSGSLVLGSGAYMTINGDFISNIPNNGKMSVFKYANESNLYGEKLGEMDIVGGDLKSPLEVSYKNEAETTYSLTFNKVSNDKLGVTLNYWQEGIQNDRIVMKIEDKNGITSIYKLNLQDFDDKSVLTIEYDNSQMGAGILPDELVNSLYFGSILNPNSYNYNDQRGKVESLNKLKITYYGKDSNIHDTIGRVELVDKDVLFKDEFDNEIVIEDTSIHRVSKREVVDSDGNILHEEGFKLRGYFNPRTNAAAIDGRYRGTLRVNIEIY